MLSPIFRAHTMLRCRKSTASSRCTLVWYRIICYFIYAWCYTWCWDLDVSLTHSSVLLIPVNISIYVTSCQDVICDLQRCDGCWWVVTAAVKACWFPYLPRSTLHHGLTTTRSRSNYAPRGKHTHALHYISLGFLTYREVSMVCCLIVFKA